MAENKVWFITGTSRGMGVEFAKAATTRPQIVGTALARVGKDPEISGALFELLETQNLLQSSRLEVSIVPTGTQLIAAVAGTAAQKPFDLLSTPPSSLVET